jgi:predicted SnoaL-like aldol condensation-catalyzing enzyme
MTEQEKINKEIVLRFNYQVIEKNDQQALNELVNPDFINHTAPPGSVQGPQGLAIFFNALHKAFTEIKIEIYDQVAEGDKVVTRKAITGIHIAPLFGITPGNKRASINIIDIIKVKDGQYTDHWSVRDMQDVISKSNN